MPRLCRERLVLFKPSLDSCGDSAIVKNANEMKDAIAISPNKRSINANQFLESDLMQFCKMFLRSYSRNKAETAISNQKNNSNKAFYCLSMNDFAEINRTLFTFIYKYGSKCF